VYVQDNVELPDPVMLAGVTLHEVLLVDRPTTPANPFDAATITVDLAAVPEITVTVVGLAEITKSWNRNVTVAL
jgi:hypothetical protein